MMFLVFF